MYKELIINMESKYPFGQVTEALPEDTTVLVEKQLPFQNSDQYSMIQQIIHSVKTARHPFLVNLLRVGETKETVKLFYEYVPFKVQKWVLSINEEIVQALKKEMLELAEFLCKANLKFRFDPEVFGLNQQMEAKYFLKQFQLDVNNWELNLQKNRQEIQTFFKQLTEGQGSSEESKQERMESISTNGSLSTADKAPKLPSSKKTVNKDDLKSKIADSKKRCQDVIEKFKNMNLKF